MNTPQRKLLAAAVALALVAGAAQAGLERVGPNGTAPSQGNYPIWYQDTSGLALEFCDPINAEEARGGWCLLGLAEVPVAPEVFPTAFFDEHFYYAASAGMTTAGGVNALLVLAVEAAFAADVVPGGQITFSRIRVRLNTAPVTGRYRFIHPYGEELIDAVQGERIFFTDDVGINCPPGTFDCALNSRLGPFVVASNAPGGAELAAIAGPVPGKLYLADPARLGPVTGSTLPPFTDSTGAIKNHNIFRIEGPAGSALGGIDAQGKTVDWIETTAFSLMGRAFTGTLPSRIDVERATYTRDNTVTKLDVFASAFPTALPRLPSQPRPDKVAPQLTFFDVPCTGRSDERGTLHPPFSAPLLGTEVQMFAAGAKHWGQIVPTLLPKTVCVKDGSARDASGRLAPAFVSQDVSDAVTVTDAQFDPRTGTLTVAATSSDTMSAPKLSLAFDSFLGELTNGQIVVPGLIAPPSVVRVLSSRQGKGEFEVRVGLGGGSTPPGVPAALNDTFNFNEDAGAQTLDVLNNDTNASGGTITITSLPQLGSVVVTGGRVTYTPKPDANGGDAFTYTATVGAQVSNVANVTMNIKPVNDAPTAVNDSTNAIANVPQLINVVANDIDPDGVTDIIATMNLSQPVGNLGQVGASTSVAGGVVTFKASAPGSYTFTYQAQDSAQVTSANTATVTVQVAAAETVNVGRAEYVRSKGRLRVQGTIDPVANQTIKLEFVNIGGAVVGLAGTATVVAGGAWALDTVVALPAGTSALRATTSNGTVRPITLTFK